MNTKNMLWAALLMTAALVMTACTSEDNTVDTPATPQAEVKTIPYSVTVGQGSDAASTRAIVESDMKTLYFADGDKLYVTGTNISGTLDIQTGTGTGSATFSGDLTYSGEGSPASDLSLTATLVSAQQTVGNEVSVSDAGAVTVNYPKTAYCDDVATAVQKYSRLTGSSTYSEKSFTLSQKTAFLNFEITFEDGTAAGTELSAVVSNGGTPLCTANVETKDVGTKVVAKFVLPVPAPVTTLSGATVKMGDKAALTINDATLDGKVYNVKRTYSASLNITSPAVGQVIGSDGKNYAAGSVPSGVTAVAIIAYVEGTSNGLAIALSDESSDWGMDWATAKTTTAAHTPAFTGGEWRLPSKPDWQNMFYANSSSYKVEKYTGLNTAITTAGGTALQENVVYWSSTPYGEVVAWYVSLDGGYAVWNRGDVDHYFLVRACLAF